MEKYFIKDHGDDFEVLTEGQAKGTNAISLFEYLKKQLDSVDASFYLYLHEFPVFGDEIGLKPEEVLPTLQRAADFLGGMTRSQVYDELCQHDKLAVFFKSEAKTLIKDALIKKANSLLNEALTL